MAVYTDISNVKEYIFAKRKKNIIQNNENKVNFNITLSNLVLTQNYNLL